MTPMAARLFRSGDHLQKAAIGGSQFFEVSALAEMAAEMVDADIAAGCAVFSEFARLPAPATVIEYVLEGIRIMLLCNEHGPDVKYIAFFQDPSGDPEPRLMGGFRRGTPEHLKGEWLEKSTSASTSLAMSASDPRLAAMSSINSALEKFLCILNQPGLVDRTLRPTDKRVLKAARNAGKPAATTWHECRIRIGAHSGGSAEEKAADGPVMPLHYVRRYFKPSTGKWVDGYWRGDAALGTHLKWYSVRPPKTGEAA